MKKKTTTDSQTSNQSTDKLLTVLECLSSNRCSLRLQDISDQTGLSQATALRYLNSLINSNYVFKDESMRYSLTWKVCKLSDNVRSNLNLRNISSTIINDISNKLHLGVCLVINHNNQCMYLDCVDDPSSLTVTLQRIGICTPLHATGSGKVLLSALSPDQLDAYIKNGLEKLTDYTITDAEALRKEIDRTKQQGYGTDDEECEMNLKCISFPIRDYQEMIVASLSAFGPLAVMTETKIAEAKEALTLATASISEKLGYDKK